MERSNERLYRMMQNDGLDGVVLCLPENVVYSSGFITLPHIYAVGFFAWSMPLATVIINLKDKKEALYVADSVMADVNRLSFIHDVRTYSPYSLNKSINPVDAYLNGLREILADIAPAKGAVGIEAAGFPYSAYQTLKATLPKVQIRDVTETVYKSKMIKAAWELKRMQKAAGVVDAGMEAFIQTSEQAGTNELDIWGEITTAMNKRAGMHTIISGELVTGHRSMNSSYPGGPIDRVTQDGDVGIMDMSARIDGYWCDCCNIVSYGGRNEAQLKYFSVIKNAYDNAVAAIKPGAVCSDVYLKAESAYKEKGFECPHYIGHSIGTGLNDIPKIIPCDHTVIEEGMCFSLEPGIYQEGMGLRIEKMVYTTKDGCREFNRFGWGVE